MPSQVFLELLTEQIEIFRYSFTSVSRSTFYSETDGKLIHAGEFGMYRETVCREFLRFFIPSRLSISQGFLINARGDVSHQCDIVVYDPNVTPLIQNENRQRFFPVEAVCAVGEVKSNLSRSDLAGALAKLAEAKRIREDIESAATLNGDPYDPVHVASDQLFTFLLCESLTFELLRGETDALYAPATPHRHKHNMILSVRDGAYTYHDRKTNTIHPWPWSWPEDEEAEELTPLPYFASLPSEEDPYSHFKIFAHALFFAMTQAPTLLPELADYMGRPEGHAFSQPSREG